MLFLLLLVKHPTSASNSMSNYTVLLPTNTTRIPISSKNTSVTSTQPLSSTKSSTTQIISSHTPSVFSVQYETSPAVLSIPKTTGFNTTQLRPDLTPNVVTGIVVGFTLLVVVSGSMFYLFCFQRRRAVGLNSRGVVENGQPEQKQSVGKEEGLGATTITTTIKTAH